MSWITPTEVVSEFNLRPEGDSPDDILRCVRKELAAIHPDRSNNVFSSPEVEQRWHKLTKAKEYLESVAHGEMAMISISQLPALLRSMREAAAEPLEERSSRFLNESRASIKQATFFPKLTSGIFAAVCAFLFTASNSLKDNET
jgi:hypothetical protein